MRDRIGVGAAVALAGVVLAILGATVGPARVGASMGSRGGRQEQERGPQDVSPAVGPLGEATPRSQAARRIADLLRDGVEVDVRQVVDGLPSPEELARRRSEIAERLMDFALVKFVEPPSPTARRGTFHAAIVDYVEWSSRRLDAELELASSDEDRQEAMARELAKLRGVEEVYRELVEAEGIDLSPQNVLELEFKRLEVESRLARLQAIEDH